MISDLGPGFRHITFDERARGRRSATSSDYSFEAAVRDVDAVLAARRVDRALGAVLVEGAQPHDWLNEAMEHRIRKLFRLMAPLTVLLRHRCPTRSA